MFGILAVNRNEIVTITDDIWPEGGSHQGELHGGSDPIHSDFHFHFSAFGSDKIQDPF